MSLKQLAQYDDAKTEAPSVMDIRTEYLDPIVSSTYKYTFRLDGNGTLDQNSMLVFKLYSNTQNNNRVNLWNGALGSIKRATFQIGDNIINDIQELWKYSTIKNLNKLPVAQRNQYFGHYIGNQLWTKVIKSATERDASRSVYSTQEGNPALVGSICNDNDRSGIEFGKYDTGADRSINSHRLDNLANIANNQQYGIPLGLLFPALKGQEIPLYLFQDQRILFTFEFNTSEYYCNNFTRQTYTNGNQAAVQSLDATSGEVIPSQVRMVVDYIAMPDEIINEQKKQTAAQGGFNLEFMDVVNVEKNIPVGTNGTIQEIEHRIGQNNREVHNIFMWKEFDSNTDYAINDNNGGGANFNGKRTSIINKFQGCVGLEEEEYNVNVDGRDEFNDFVLNPVSQYNEHAEALGVPPRLVRPLFVCDGNTLQNEVAVPLSGLNGMMKPLAVSLRNGEPAIVGGGRRIGQYPIVWKYKRRCDNAITGNCPATNKNMKVNYLIEVSKFANIRQVGTGNSVMVSY